MTTKFGEKLLTAEEIEGYSNDSISVSEGPDTLRKRPATMLGTDDERGAFHTIWEVLANANDEANDGFSDSTKITVFNDGSVEVEDKGRGVPMGWNPKVKKYNYILIFCTLFASGKGDSSNYKNSAGLNGVGATAAQFTSEYMDVVSVRDEAVEVAKDSDGNPLYKQVRTRYEMHFKKGRPVGELKVDENVNLDTGTVIKFKPDIEVFRGADSVVLPLETVLDRVRRDAMLIPNCKFTVKYMDREPIVMQFPGGAMEWLNEVCKETLTGEFIHCSGELTGQDEPERNTATYAALADITFGFSRKDTVIEKYHNGNEIPEGGTSFDGFKEAIVNVVNDYARQTGKLSKGDRYTAKDVEDLIVGVISTKCPGHLTSWMHQTKVAITNKLIKTLVKDLVTRDFTHWSMSHQDEMSSLIEQIELNRKLRLERENITKKFINNLKKDGNKFKDKVEKLVRCKSENPEECELYITEGDSAKGPVVLARDFNTQAVLPLRGKVLNCQRESLTSAISSQVIVDILRCLSCGVERSGEGLEDIPKFDIEKLRYHKIIICTDADDDGDHIKCLILAMLWNLVPTLVRDGYVYVALSPLFIVAHNEGKKRIIDYAYNTSEKDRVLSRLRANGISDKDIVVKRLKGLGETQEDVMNETVMDKKNRRLLKMSVKNEIEFNALMDSLMGADSASRRSLIETYFDYEFPEIEFDGEEALETAETVDLTKFNNF